MKLDKNKSKVIRDSYEESLFPSKFSTWLTGKPLKNSTPAYTTHWIFYCVFIIAIFVSSLYLGFYNQIENQSFFYILLSWFGLVFSSRRMAAVILHQSVHDRLSGIPKLDKFIGDFVTLLMITQDYETYKFDHCSLHHNPLTFATKYDPIVKFFSFFGINLGIDKKRLYANFIINLISPFFHLSFFINRIKYNFTTKRPIRSLFSLLYVSLLLFISYELTGSILSLFIIFIIPLVYLYQISALIEICSEHAWFENKIMRKEELIKEPYFYADISWGRFCGTKYPSSGKLKVILWYVENIFYHLPVRLFILVGDLPQHDYHHRKPLCFNWTNARYNREKAIYELDENEPEYMDIWGLHNAIEYVFTVVSRKNSDFIAKFNQYAKD